MVPLRLSSRQFIYFNVQLCELVDILECGFQWFTIAIPVIQSPAIVYLLNYGTVMEWQVPPRECNTENSFNSTSLHFRSMEAHHDENASSTRGSFQRLLYWCNACFLFDVINICQEWTLLLSCLDSMHLLNFSAFLIRTYPIPTSPSFASITTRAVSSKSCYYCFMCDSKPNFWRLGNVHFLREKIVLNRKIFHHNLSSRLPDEIKS